MEQYVLDNGWIIIKKGDKFFLEVKPIENSLFRINQTVEVTEEIFNAVKNGETRVSELKKFNLYKYVIKWGKPKRSPIKKNTDTKYYGGGFFVEKIDGKYFLEYMSGAQGGKSKREEINEKIYLEARSGKYKYKLSELIRKYDLY